MIRIDIDSFFFLFFFLTNDWCPFFKKTVLHLWSCIFLMGIFRYCLFLSCASDASQACVVLCVCNMVHFFEGRKVLRAADGFHEPLLPHKRQHVLSNCQNFGFEDCERSTVWGFSIIVTPAVFFFFLHMCLCIDKRVRTPLQLSISQACPCLSVHSRLREHFQHVCFLFDNPSTLIHFTEVCRAYAAHQWTC